MILPSKGVPASKAIVTVGADVLATLGDSSLSVSSLWSQVKERRAASDWTRVSYDWFVLALDFLYAVGAIELTPLGLLSRAAP